MTIRAATPHDAQAIAQVHVASWQCAYRDILPEDFLADLAVEMRRAMWAESIAMDKPHVLVAQANGQVVGFSAIGPCRDAGTLPTAFEVWAIYLSPSCWSKGMGRKLWLATREYAIGQGATSIQLWVLAKNDRAIRFYRAAGYQPLPRTPRTSVLGGVPVEEVGYVLQLDR